MSTPGRILLRKLKVGLSFGSFELHTSGHRYQTIRPLRNLLLDGSCTISPHLPHLLLLLLQVISGLMPPPPIKRRLLSPRDLWPRWSLIVGVGRPYQLGLLPRIRRRRVQRLGREARDSRTGRSYRPLSKSECVAAPQSMSLSLLPGSDQRHGLNISVSWFI